MNTPDKRQDDADAFAREAEQQEQGFFAEFRDFLLHNKKWWMLPIVVVVLLMGALIMMAGSGAAPFIYTLF